jgi:hypothetical protein
VVKGRVGYISLLLNVMQFAYIVYLNRSINDLGQKVHELNEKVELSVADFETFKHFYCQCMENVPKENKYHENPMARACDM